MGQIISGTALSSAIDRTTTEQAAALVVEGIVPTLAVVWVGEAAAADSYRRQITRQADTVGIAVRNVALSAGATDTDLEETLADLNRDHTVHGVLVQAPLSPAHRHVVQSRLSSDKDPEGVTPRHLGMLFLSISGVLPCTPAAIVTIIKSVLSDLVGARVAIVNGSPLIGRPLAMLLLDEGATPIICTENTRDLAAETSRAEILVTAAGRPGLIGVQHVAQGAVVIDAAVNSLPDGRLVGDVDLEAVLDRVSAITPVPGGVGLVTTATLLANVATLASLYRGKTRDFA